MNPKPLIRTTARSSRALTKRFSSSQAGPSTPPTSPAPAPSKSNPFLRHGKLPANTLRSLVDLHHNSAVFLHSPDEISTGFYNIFRNLNEPTFVDYKAFHDGAMANKAPAGGVQQLVRKSASVDGHGGVYGGESLATSKPLLPIFKDHEEGLFSTSVQGGSVGVMTERELRVKEALYGTWEREKGVENVQPGLDGVMEYLEAKGMGVEESAREWKESQESHEGAKNEA
ncbi:hypothetical protein P7C73_g3764, partial [Tremellales sp. Uapishka_1]